MSDLDEAILRGDVSEALRLTGDRTPASVFDQIDYQAMSDDAEPYMAFARAYYHSAGTLDRVAIADWILGHSVAELAYLDIQAEAARLLTSAVAGAVLHLADQLDGTTTVAYGPDAGLTRAQSAHYRSIAETLRGFEIPIAAQSKSD